MPPTLSTPSDHKRLALSLLAPSASSSPWDWAVEELIMPTGGRFQARRGEIMRYWYKIFGARISGQPLPDDPLAHQVERLWLVLVAQLAKTTTENAWALWTARHHPRKIAMFMKREKDLSLTRKSRLRPHIEQTRHLAELLPIGLEAREQALSANLYRIGGAELHFGIGQVPDDWRSQDYPLMFLDEFDVYPPEVGDQGDPIDLGLVRQRTYPHERLMVGLTTPSSITAHGWRRLCEGSHQRPLVTCHACGAAHWLDWRCIVHRSACANAPGGDDRDLGLIDYPPRVIRDEHLARWQCPYCGHGHDDRQVRARAVEAARSERWVAGTWDNPDTHPAGLWTPTHAELDRHGRIQHINPPSSIFRSGWASALHSVDVSLSSFAESMVRAAQGTEGQRRTWTNTEANEPFIYTIEAPSVDEIDKHTLAGYAHGSCPVTDDGWLMLFFDQQGNQRHLYWYPWVLRYFVPGGRSWLVAAGKADGDHTRDQLEDRLWPIGGHHRAADVIAIDGANPNFRQDAYLWAADDPHRRLVVRGDSRLQPGETWAEVTASRTHHRRISRPDTVREWRIHPHYWRSELHERIMGRSPIGWHLPDDAPDYYRRSLTSEEPTLKTRRIVGGGHEEVIVWEPRITTKTNERINRRTDNHWWDGEANLLALANILGIDAAATPPAQAAAEADTPQGDGGDPLADDFGDYLDGGDW
jgi:hypothetical protein